MKIQKEYGYIQYSIDDCNDTEMNIDNVYVETGYRGRGYGRQLIEEAILEISKIESIETIGLYAEPQTDDGLSEDALIEFYKSFGFESNGDCNNLMTLRI